MATFDKKTEKAQKLLQRGKVEDALEEFLLVYQDHPGDTELLHTIADLFVQTRRTDEAVHAYQELIDKAHASNAFNKALFYHRKIIKLTPEDPRKVLDLAHYLIHHNKIDDAVVEFINAGKLHEALDQIPQAMQCFERVVELLPQESQYHEMLAEFAAAHASSAVAERSFLGAAKLHLHRKEIAAAEKDFARALEISPKNLDTLLELARLQESAKQWDTVAHMLEPAFLEHSVNPHVLDLLGLAYFNLNLLDNAEEIWTRLFQLQPESYHRLVLLAERWLERRNYATALKITMMVKDHCLKIRQSPVVIRLLETVVQLNPTDTNVLSQLAAIHLASGNRQAYKECLDRLFEAYVKTKNFTVGAEVLDNLISVDPTHAKHSERVELLRKKISAEKLQSLEANLEKATVYRRSSDAGMELGEGSSADDQGGGSGQYVPSETIEDRFLQAELFLKYRMNDRALGFLEEIERIPSLPPDFRERYVELCEALGRPARLLKKNPSAAPSPKDSPGPIEIVRGRREGRRTVTLVGREIETLSAIYRKIHLQLGAKAVLYTAVHELGKFLNVTRSFAALSAPSKPAGSYLEYCAPPRGKSDPNPLAKLLQFCDGAVTSKRQPILSDRAVEDPELAPIRRELRDLGVLSLVVWPLQNQNQVLGFLGLQQGDVIRSWSGEEILILQSVAEQVSVALAQARMRHLMRTLAVTDEETGLISRHSFFDCLVSEIERSKNQGSALCVVLLDLVQLPELDRSRGAFYAMQLLRDFSQYIFAHTRETDTVVRLDRTVIALILPDTPFQEAESVIQKLASFATVDLAGRTRPSDEAASELFISGAAEALITPHIDPYDSATDVVFRVEQSLAQSRDLSSISAPVLRQSEARR